MMMGSLSAAAVLLLAQQSGALAVLPTLGVRLAPHAPCRAAPPLCILEPPLTGSAAATQLGQKQPSAALSAPAAKAALDPVEEEPPTDLWTWRLLLLGITAVWGSNFVVTKSALDALGNTAADGSLFLASRFALSAVLLAPALSNPSWPVLRAAASVGSLCVFGYAAQSLALGLGTSASTAAFMCTLQAVVVALAAGRKQALPTRTYVAVATAILGIGCLELLPPALEGGLLSGGAAADGAAAAPYSFCIGDLVALGQPLGFGCSYVVLEGVMQEHPEDELSISAIQCFVIAAASLGAASAAFGAYGPGAAEGAASALAAPWALPWDHLLPASTGAATANAPLGQWTVLAAVGYGGAIATALTIWLQAKCFTRLPSIDASIILASEPLWAALGASLVLGEEFGISQSIGGTLILLAIAVQEKLLPGMGGDKAEH